MRSSERYAAPTRAVKSIDLRLTVARVVGATGGAAPLGVDHTLLLAEVAAHQRGKEAHVPQVQTWTTHGG